MFIQLATRKISQNSIQYKQLLLNILWFENFMLIQLKQQIIDLITIFIVFVL